ncbi:hypothetical protein CKA32_000067 [Geitlerinema sp. FC II]|uniref:hypothetical protein n=1 Tax=Baaleninema simplex TaxID=2862350 RepID=UPI0011817F6F|nr:hypothetical protein [Baaleninema simplex]MDC0832969.1 hypothetical protein [Geitlerinema sp. CS-897]PPT05198.1 hypothetical protein CKA32_000067 [Geitlerinema sp. FC II]
MVKLSEQKKKVLEQFNLQELALLVSETLAVESERQGGNFTLERLSYDFGTLAFKYGDVLKAVPTPDFVQSERCPNGFSVRA